MAYLLDAPGHDKGDLARPRATIATSRSRAGLDSRTGPSPRPTSAPAVGLPRLPAAP